MENVTLNLVAVVVLLAITLTTVTDFVGFFAFLGIATLLSSML